MSRQLTLFHLDHVDTPVAQERKDYAKQGIQGLYYYPNFLHSFEHDHLLRQVDQQEWLTDLKRRVQHYGYQYNYKKRQIDDSMKLGSLPNWLAEVAFQILRKHIIDFLPDQVIVNEYLPGQGIASHIDCEPCFGAHILSLSLGASTNMVFTQKSDPTNKVRILLEKGSLLLLKGAARYDWLHGITPSKYYYDDSGKRFERNRRVSLTFRSVLK